MIHIAQILSVLITMVENSMSQESRLIMRAKILSRKLDGRTNLDAKLKRKILKIATSCETLSHLEFLSKYLNFAMRRINHRDHWYLNCYLNFAADKAREFRRENLV